MSGLRPLGTLAGLGLALVATIGVAADPPVIVISPPEPRPGDVLLIRVAGAPPDLGGHVGESRARFFPVPGGMAALVGVDLDRKPGPIPWRLTRPGPDQDERVLSTGSVTLGTRTFAGQSLTLPPGQVDLDAATLARVRREQAELGQALARSMGARLWQGPFRVPVEGGRPTGGFGLRRTINGQPRSPHTGYDWAAPRGTPVLAANDGQVLLVAEHFFPGRLVALDHGLGLVTLYFHLDDTRVAAGERVARGQRLGSVGASGRATGPHLHFGVWLDGARVDPLALLALPLDGLPN